MANIRIRDLANLASSSASDDFLALDGLANGTRKLNAFSPTFGGNATVTGTLTVSGASAFFGSNTGSPYVLIKGGSSGTNGGGSLVVENGSGGSVIGIGNVSAIAGGAYNNDPVLWYAGSESLRIYNASTEVANFSSTGLFTLLNQLKVSNGSVPDLWLQNTAGANSAYRNVLFRQNSNGTFKLLTTSDAGVLTLDNILVGDNATGTLLFGTATNSNNGRLQLAAHTAISGGIGFGPNMALYLRSANSVRLESTTSGTLFEVHDGSRGYQFITSGGNDLVLASVGNAANGLYLRAHSGPLVLQSNSTTALTLDSTQNATFAKDVLLGTSGPSVPSTLSGRAPRQGLVFDGTIGADVSVPAFGTSDFTVAVWARTNNAATPNYITVGNTGVFGSLSLGDGSLYYFKSGGVGNRQVPGVFVSNKFVFVVIAKASGVVRTYVDGVLVDTWTDTNDAGGGYTSAITKIGGLATQWWNGTLVPIIYNRALSAAEVKALYENGAPEFSDLGIFGSIAPSNTGLTTSSVAQNFQYDTFSATTNSFTAVETGGQACEANFISGTTFLGKASKNSRYLVQFTATLTSGAVPTVRLSVQGVSGVSSAIVNVAAGANSILLQITEAFTAETGTGSGRVTFATSANTSYAISGLTVTRLGAVLAPDATQTGGGLTWYDTSGNAANITLPASGVSWNVPWAGSLTPSGAATPVLIKKTQAYLEVNSDDLRRGRFGADGSNAVSLGTLTNVPLDFFVNSVAAARFAATSGNFLIGTVVDSGAKLQVGTNTTAASGGMIFGTDVTLYRSAADTLKTDDAFVIQRDINQEFFGFNVANANTGTSALVTASVSNGAYGAGFTMGGQNFTNTSFLRGNRLALTGPFDINYVSAQHFFWIGGGGAGTSTAGSQLVFSLGLGAKITHSPISFSTNSWLTNGVIAEFSGSTVTNNSTAASGTAASAVAYSFAVPSFAATNASVTTTNAATLYVAGNPTASTNQTFTNAWGIWNAGRTKLGGFVRIDDTSTSSSKDTGCLVVEGGIGVEENVNVGGFYGLADGIAAPGAATGYARIYVDTADGDLKVIFGDGTIKTIATDS